MDGLPRHEHLSILRCRAMAVGRAPSISGCAPAVAAQAQQGQQQGITVRPMACLLVLEGSRASTLQGSTLKQRSSSVLGRAMLWATVRLQVRV
jgi:hypothetical protein